MSGTTERTGGSLTATSGPAEGGRRGATAPDSHYRRTVAAWERFASGKDAVSGIRPEILMSWYRCREEYKVDPQLTQAPPAPEQAPHGLEHDTVFAELGGLAALAAQELEMADGLTTVTDGQGRILASWGDDKVLREAEESNLAPWATWSEAASGTNGMGTALESHHPVLVRGPEHWCRGFHDWSCAGAAIRDVVTDEPIAVLNVSRRHGDLPPVVTGWLGQAAGAVYERLHRRARDTGTELVAAFTEARPRVAAPLAALDASGKVVIANEDASILLGVPADAPATDPEHRWIPQVPELRGLAARAAERAQLDHRWTGATHIFDPFTGNDLSVAVRPVLRNGHVIGMLIAGGAAAGERIPAAGAKPPEPRMLPGRVIARRGTRLVVLAAHEIRYAESDGNTIWLVTDPGRLQATTQGLDNLGRQLAGHGFLRVHRRFLVNLRRVREVEQGFKGGLFLITDARARESVPVSRRHAAGLRRVLGV
jgi:hypothetical protein